MIPIDGRPHRPRAARSVGLSHRATRPAAAILSGGLEASGSPSPAQMAPTSERALLDRTDSGGGARSRRLVNEVLEVIRRLAIDDGH